MSRLRRWLVTLLCILCSFSLTARGAAQTNSPANPPRVFLLDAKQLSETRAKLRAGDTTLAPALEQLKKNANAAMSAGSFSVTFKTKVPPSGDKHDYLSQAPYFWPNPDTSNGLPYVRHDGRRNPEINRISDHGAIADLSDTVHTLALAFYFTGDETYAARAVKLIRTWFLDPATRMNPNFEFAQGIPGITTGRGFGLIESRGLTRVTDAAGLLAGSTSWTQADQRGLEEWFTKFSRWMRESSLGREEAAAKNNHGTYYDVQIACYELFLGNHDRAKEILETVRTKRIAAQIEPDGRQPLELARTNGWSYSVANLNGLIQLADLGERVGVDLWDFRTTDGRCIRKAIEYLAPFAYGEKKWPYPTSSASRSSLEPIVRRAALHYRDGSFQAIAAKAGAASSDDRMNLLNARPANANTVEE